MEIKNFWNTTTVAPNGTWLTVVPEYSETIIVGGGGAGLATAASLGLRGYKEVLVLDSILPAWRGARRGIGAATLLSCTPHKLFEAGIQTVNAFRALRMCFIGIKNVNEYIQRFWPNTDWCRKVSFGGFHFATNREEEKLLEDVNKFYQYCEVHTSIMEPDAISRLTDMRIGHKGLFVPTECMVNPAKFFNGLLTGIRSMGMTVISGFTVDNAYQEGKHWVISDFNGNLVRCKNLIVCTGSNLSALPSNDDLNEFITRKRVTYFATPEVTNHRLNPYVMSTLDGKEIYRRYENRIIGCIDTNDGVPIDMKGPDVSAIEKATHRLSVLYPLTKSEQDIEYIWTKNTVQTKDSLPIIGEVSELKNLYLNIGYNQHALSWQMIGGAVITELLLGSKKNIGEEIFSPQRIFR